MADGGAVEHHEVVGLADLHPPDVVDAVAEDRAHVVEERASRAHEPRAPLEAEAVESRHLEVALQALASGVEAEDPAVGRGDARALGADLRLRRADDFRRARPVERLVQLGAALELLDHELAGRQVQERKR